IVKEKEHNSKDIRGKEELLFHLKGNSKFDESKFLSLMFNSKEFKELKSNPILKIDSTMETILQKLNEIPSDSEIVSEEIQTLIPSQSIMFRKERGPSLLLVTNFPYLDLILSITILILNLRMKRKQEKLLK